MEPLKPRVKVRGQSVSVGATPSRRGVIFAVIALCIGVFMVWSAYDFGQSRAGYNRRVADERYAALEVRLRESQAERLELRERVAQLETNLKIDAEAHRRVREELAGLQDEILEQEEDLEFYRGILADQTGLRVQNLELTQGEDAASFNVYLVLAQAIRGERRVTGHVELEVEGTSDGEPLTLTLAQLAGDAEAASGGRLAFSFRYFQSLRTGLTLPDGFAPALVKVILRPKGKSEKPVEKSFQWTVRQG